MARMHHHHRSRSSAMGRIEETFERSGFHNQALDRSPLRIAHCLNLMQRDHTAKADIDELEVLHDESNRALFWDDYRLGGDVNQRWKHGSRIQPNY
jgi:hypothetical protein